MSDRYDCSDPEQRAAGLKAAAEAVRRGELIVLPTDTVYGVGAEAFSPAAITGLLAAKRRGRDMPPPVLVGTRRAATALVEELGDVGKDLIDEFWPGGLTLVCRAQRSLSWDLGDTRGTVAIRMPLHPVALDLLKETGPLAVSSANVSGMPASTTVDEAVDQLGDTVAVFLDDGPATGGVPSTIVDLTGAVPKLLRAGAIPVEELTTVAVISTGSGPADADAALPSEAVSSLAVADGFEAGDGFEGGEDVEAADDFEGEKDFEGADDFESGGDFESGDGFEAGDDFEGAEPAENVEISDAYPMAPGTAPTPAADECPAAGGASGPGGGSGPDRAPDERREEQ
jgi:tRNA threonylcarbamoyl adenosine modification protein (Sua5/YciO/YrdC/YwlC family)